MLKCGLHKCPSSCHQLFDHSKIRCNVLLKQKCPKGHSQSWQCHSGAAPVACQKCERETKDAQRKLQRALEEQQRRDENLQRHLREVAKLQEEIDKVMQGIKDERLNAEQAAVLAQKKKDLAAARELANTASLKASQKATHVDKQKITPHAVTIPAQGESSQAPHSTPSKTATLQKSLKACLDHKSSASRTEWQRQKDIENASNPAIDAIMEMIGLEEVKSQVLQIKSKVETSLRQGTDLKKERLGLVLLGNPGTGWLFNP